MERCIFVPLSPGHLKKRIAGHVSRAPSIVSFSGLILEILADQQGQSYFGLDLFDL